ncbi:MAG TPA: hypothetical protein VFR37_18680 [Longimicrobium sp.]|nr:hypothetical protein [Longimicrobium sp.]
MSKAPGFLFAILTAAFATLPVPAPAAAQEAGVLRGRVVTADGARTDSLRAFVRWRMRGDTAVRVDSAAVDSTGRFALPLAGEAGDSLELVVDAIDRGRRTHHPALVRIHRRETAWEHGIVLVPRTWTIPAGRYAGERVSVRPHLARTPVCRRCSVFWVQMQLRANGPVRWQGWPLSRFPLRVGFDRQHSVPVGAAPDSAAFWWAVERVEDAFGTDLFRPVRYAQTLPRHPEDNPDDVVLVVIDPSLGIAGLTTVLGRTGTVEYATVSFQHRASLMGSVGPELVGHELMHVLGFGHTCSWRSLAADLQRCPQLRTTLPTPEDVAYAQLFYRVRDLQRASGARWGLEAAVAGERVLVLGLPEEP